MTRHGVVDIDQHLGADWNKFAQVVNALSAQLTAECGGGVIMLGAREYVCTESVVLTTGVVLEGVSPVCTALKAAETLSGPIVRSKRLSRLDGTNAWFLSEGVPCAIGVRNLRIEGNFKDHQRTVDGPYDECGIAFYAKGYTIDNVLVLNTNGHGVYSCCAQRGGQEHDFLDMPEATLDMTIKDTGRHGMLFRGPHDSVLSKLIIARSRGKGLVLEAKDGEYDGACDILFCHSYGSLDTAIDLRAKFKAVFLQADAGVTCGINFQSGQRSFCATAEVFKTRGNRDRWAVNIRGEHGLQIGTLRVRADWGAGGVLVNSPHTSIATLHCNGARDTGGPLHNTPNDTTGLKVLSPGTSITNMSIINFDEGVGVELAPGARQCYLQGRIANCREPLRNNLSDAADMQGSLFFE